MTNYNKEKKKKSITDGKMCVKRVIVTFSSQKNKKTSNECEKALTTSNPFENVTVKVQL